MTRRLICGLELGAEWARAAVCRPDGFEVSAHRLRVVDLARDLPCVLEEVSERQDAPIAVRWLGDAAAPMTVAEALTDRGFQVEVLSGSTVALLVKLERSFSAEVRWLRTRFIAAAGEADEFLAVDEVVRFIIHWHMRQARYWLATLHRELVAQCHGARVS